MPLETTPVEIADYLRDDEARAEFLNDALDSGDAKYLAHALGILARSRKHETADAMGIFADEIGVARSGLYKALSKDGNPRLTTFLSVINGLGLKLKAVSV